MGQSPAADVLAATRESLHRVAEHVLSAARQRATGRIGLVPGPGGFSTPPLPDGTVLGVEGTDVVVRSPAGTRRAPITTLGAAAALAGTDVGSPGTVYPPATSAAPDDPLDVDAAAARLLADWYALGAQALSRLARDLADDAPTPPQLWPEHFDLAVEAGGITYGFSPGDDVVPVPYAYVGPHGGPPTRDALWNAPFGAYRTHEEIGTPQGAVAFFLAARQRLRRAQPDTPVQPDTTVRST